MDRIVKILEVVDTRHWEEGADDKWYPIPGSGIEHECDRCGRFHEIHATVLLESGKTAIVGTGCMGREDMAMAKRFQRADRAAKRIAELKAKITPLLIQQQVNERIWSEVDRLPLPPIIEGPSSWNPDQFALRMQDAEVGVFSSGYLEYEGAKRSLISIWKANRSFERGSTPTLAYEIDSLARQLETTERRLSEIMAET